MAPSDLDLVSEHLVYEGDDNDDGDDSEELDVLSGDADALWGDGGLVKGDDLAFQEAQSAIRKLLAYVRDCRLKAGVPAMQVTSPTVGAQIVRVDTPQSAAQMKTAKTDFESAVDGLTDLPVLSGEEDVLEGEDAIEGEGEDVEEIPLKFNRPDHDHNVNAWKKGDDINVSMRVLKANGQPRVLTATTSHEAEMKKIVECLKQLGYTPDKILRLPLDELAARLGASGLIRPTIKHAGAILGLDTGNAPYTVGLRRIA